MICYRDMTFCTFYEDCKHKDTCKRPLTDEVQHKAKAWWGSEGEAPIAIFTDKPECWESDNDRT